MARPGAVPLSPISFLQRAGDVFPDKLAVVTESGRNESYGAFRAEADLVADGLRQAGVGPGRQVAVLSRNGPDLLRLHFAVPGAGGALVALNIRLAPREYAYILADSRADLLFLDPGLRERIQPVLGELSCEIVDLPDPATGVESDGGFGTPYRDWLGAAPGDAGLQLPADENDPLAINYTSGTTGRPKGAVYTHRGAYLNALGLALELQMAPSSTYLWTLPMFHCNGWSCTWGVTAIGAAHVTLADFDPHLCLELIGRHQVSHLCGAPVVLNALAEAGTASAEHFDHVVRIATGGAAPSPTTIGAMAGLGIEVIHLYGLTETYGPSLICEVQPGWEDLGADELSRVMARQGVRTIVVHDVRVVDEQFRDVPADGESMGQIVVRSNTVVPGYFHDEARTEEATRAGWLLTGDLAVVHEDGYLEVKDRGKDIIISGGENVSSIEVENVLVSHPAVSEAAVVGVPHEKWGEVPVAYVTLRAGVTATPAELISYVRERLAHFKAPKAVMMGELPKTSTGKVQKFELRNRALPPTVSESTDPPS